MLMRRNFQKLWYDWIIINKPFLSLNSLFEGEYLEKNKEEIEQILVEYKINNLFDLGLNILNKENNVIYNNFLGKNNLYK